MLACWLVGFVLGGWFGLGCGCCYVGWVLGRRFACVLVCVLIVCWVLFVYVIWARRFGWFSDFVVCVLFWVLNRLLLIWCGFGLVLGCLV